MTNDLISRQAAIDEIEYEIEMINSALDSITLDFHTEKRLRQRRGEAREILNLIQQLPSEQSDIMEKILAAGKEGKEVRIYIGGRLFAVRELAQ